MIQTLCAKCEGYAYRRYDGPKDEHGEDRWQVLVVCMNCGTYPEQQRSSELAAAVGTDVAAAD